MYFETDKQVYKTNDKFELTLFIHAEEEEDIKVRFFKDYRNIDISFISLKNENEFAQKLSKTFIEGPSLFGNNDELIDEYIVTSDKPFIKIFTGKIVETNDQISLKIPELNISNHIDKSVLIKNPTITIKGSCRTIYSSEIKQIPNKEFNVLIK